MFYKSIILSSIITLFSQPAFSEVVKLSVNSFDFSENTAYDLADDFSKNLSQINSKIMTIIENKFDNNPYVIAGAIFWSIKFNRANSAYFMHEMIHHAAGKKIGAQSFYFLNSNGEVISHWEAYKNLLIDGSVGGPAVSTNYKNPNVDYIDMTVAGINYQTEFAKKWWFDILSEETPTKYTYTHYLINKAHLALYAYTDHERSDIYNNLPTTGDIMKYVSHLNKKYDSNISEGDIFTSSLITLLLSPGAWLLPRIEFDQFDNKHLYFDVNSSWKMSYDLNNFVNADAYTLNSTIYLTKDFKNIYELGYEKSIYGESKDEFSIGYRYVGESSSLSSSLTSDRENYFAQISYENNLSEGVSLFADLNYLQGDTWKSKRLTPSEISLGVKVSF